MQKTISKKETSLMNFGSQGPGPGTEQERPSDNIRVEDKVNRYGFAVGNGGYWKVPIIGYAVTKARRVRLITSAEYPKGGNVGIFMNGYRFRESSSETGKWDRDGNYLIDSELDIPVIKLLDNLMGERGRQGIRIIDSTAGPSHQDWVYKKVAGNDSPLFTFYMLPDVYHGRGDEAHPFSLSVYRSYNFSRGNREMLKGMS